jgi:hypothetical protein
MEWFFALSNVAIIAAVLGLAAVIKFGGPPFAAGFLAGLFVFALWYRGKHGNWP